MKTSALRFAIVLLILTPVFQGANCNISLPEIFSDNMVLQQKSDVTIWGWAKTGEKVVLKAEWLGSEISTTADNQGKWNLVLKTPEAGGPFNITLKGYNEFVLKNVLIGEVWLCSGQSNMEWSAASGINNAQEEIKNANNPEIRFFSVYNATSQFPQDHLTGEWTVCTSETMRSFSIIAYLYARRLQEVLGVPVGVINSSWGGTPAEAWMPEDATGKDDFLREAAAKQKPVPWGPVEPGRIYNSMISPLVPFRIAGAIWYQGEANTVNAYAYKELLSALVKSWRTGWGYEFPFYYAQIAPYKYGRPFEGVEVREAQRKALSIPNSGMVVLSDIGDTSDIHPKNKQDVALRMANLALNRHYDKLKTEDSGPLYREMRIDKNKAIISFDHADGLYVKGSKLNCFEIAGEDMVFYPAGAKIKDNQVIVQSDKVKIPVAVRFAWSNTATPNLFNAANLPASCFRTEP
jgi:sialate O-acetylesterase